MDTIMKITRRHVITERVRHCAAIVDHAVKGKAPISTVQMSASKLRVKTTIVSLGVRFNG
jgi:hypothetical protein